MKRCTLTGGEAAPALVAALAVTAAAFPSGGAALAAVLGSNQEDCESEQTRARVRQLVQRCEVGMSDFNQRRETSERVRRHYKQVIPRRLEDRLLGPHFFSRRPIAGIATAESTALRVIFRRTIVAEENAEEQQDG